MTVRWLIALIVIVGTTRARAAEPATSEARECARLLTEAHASGWAERLRQITWNDHYAEVALTQMNESGDLRDEARTAALRAQLKLGAVFAREGLVHEAIYQTLMSRYQTPARAREVLRNFKYLSDARDQGRLIAEVIERTLQFVPDVTTDNVDRLTARAAFLNLTAGQLREFRDKWQAYDDADGFARLLQGAVLALLTSGDPRLVHDVEARGGFLRRVFARAGPGALPAPPTSEDDTADPRRVATENAAHFATDAVFAYLDASSVAARRYFVMTRMDHLNLDQLRAIDARAERYGLKDSLRRTLAREIDRRRPLVAAFVRWREATARDVELVRALDRVERPITHDKEAAQAVIGRLWRTDDVPELTRASAELIERVGREGTPAQLTGLVVSVRDATLSRLGGKTGPTEHLIELIVARGNNRGLDAAQHRKITAVLNDLVERLPRTARARSSRRVAELEVYKDDLPAMNPPALRHRRAQSQVEVIDRGHDLARAWAAYAESEL